MSIPGFIHCFTSRLLQAILRTTIQINTKENCKVLVKLLPQSALRFCACCACVYTPLNNETNRRIFNSTPHRNVPPHYKFAFDIIEDSNISVKRVKA